MDLLLRSLLERREYSKHRRWWSRPQKVPHMRCLPLSHLRLPWVMLAVLSTTLNVRFAGGLPRHEPSTCAWTNKNTRGRANHLRRAVSYSHISIQVWLHMQTAITTGYSDSLVMLKHSHNGKMITASMRNSSAAT